MTINAKTSKPTLPKSAKKAVAIPINQKKNLAKAIEEWLTTGHRFSHWVTLAPNRPYLTEKQMRSALKKWDAKVNREVYGPNWTSKRDELIWYFAVLEKPDSNPHWHLLLRICGPTGSDLKEETKRFLIAARSQFARTIKSGTIDIQEVDQGSVARLVNYASKQLRNDLQYSEFVTPDEFRRRIS